MSRLLRNWLPWTARRTCGRVYSRGHRRGATKSNQGGLVVAHIFNVNNSRRFTNPFNHLGKEGSDGLYHVLFRIISRIIS